MYWESSTTLLFDSFVLLYECCTQGDAFSYYNLWLVLFNFRFVIKDKDTFFTNSQRSKICYEILSRTHFSDFDDDEDKINKKFGKMTDLFIACCMLTLIYYIDYYFLVKMTYRLFVHSLSFSLSPSWIQWGVNKQWSLL